MELTITNYKHTQYSNSYCMLKGLQTNYDILKAYELSKKNTRSLASRELMSAHWDLELLLERGKA